MEEEIKGVKGLFPTVHPHSYQQSITMTVSAKVTSYRVGPDF